MADPTATDPTNVPNVPMVTSAGATAVLDPPDAAENVGDLGFDGSLDEQTEANGDASEPEPLFPTLTEGWKTGAHQTIAYHTDEHGRLRGADVMMWKDAPESSGLTYRAAIRWDTTAGLYRWYEPDNDAPGGWKMVKRGQAITQLTPIVEQAIEWATGRVFGRFPT